jgi:hypothetical protein
MRHTTARRVYSPTLPPGLHFLQLFSAARAWAHAALAIS